eukprot:359336-Chlamydomonas_euryale.AAC.3
MGDVVCWGGQGGGDTVLRLSKAFIAARLQKDVRLAHNAGGVMHGWVDGWLDGRIHGWIGKKIDGGMDGQTDGLTDGRVGRGRTGCGQSLHEMVQLHTTGSGGGGVRAGDAMCECHEGTQSVRDAKCEGIA